MTMRELTVEGLPNDVIVRASARRRKTLTAFRENGKTVVVVPERLHHSAIKPAVEELVARLQARQHKLQRSDSQLLMRAAVLRQQFVPEAPEPLSVTWSDRQRRRWGSCTSADRTIRLSSLLQTMPDYVIDAVLIHELAHLVHSGHGPDFQAVLHRFDKHEQAQAFLAGYSHAQEFSPVDHPR